ncbi:MAG TPA: amidohydrolase family protein [Thermoanaerobaculia bacterium]|jgi:imidazolonepropionase-like amidohydrolase|nr:amidohydrolase family protein [Thermoanaerobaculia bacterium]
MGRARLFALSLLVCLPLGAAAPKPGEELRYTIFLGNLKPSGVVTYRVNPDGAGFLTLEVSDRGRGQKISNTFQLDKAGIPVKVHLTGQDYWKSPVDETFEIKGRKAVWSNSAEKGEARISQPTFYYTLLGGHQELGMLAMALLRAPRHRLFMLPEGETSIERIGATRLASKGRVLDLTLYAISGLGYEPFYVWMESPSVFFGRYDGFVTVVREGWEDAAPDLIKAQVDAVAQRARDLAAKLSHRPAGPLAVKGARLFDPETGEVLPGTTVVVSGNRIQAVGRDGEVSVPAGAEIIDAKGKMLLPGLWDMHQHLVETDGILDLAAGITSSRDLGNDTDQLLRMKGLWDSGKNLGPRVVLGGVIEGPGPYAAPTKVLVDTEEKARAAVDRYAELGYEQIKVYSSLDPKLVPPIVEEAHRHGLRLSGHIPFGMNAEQAVRAGFDEIQHITFLFLNFMPEVDTRTPARFSAVYEHGAELDLQSEPVRAFLRLLQEKGTVVDPTVSIYENRLMALPGQVSPSIAPVAERVPFAVRRTLLATGLPVPEDMRERYQAVYHNMMTLLRTLYGMGIPIVAGTDGPAGFTLHRELENYVAAGIPAPEVLKIATLGAARVTRHDKDLGTIAPGKLADFILVDGDPVTRIEDIRRAVLTVKDGIVYKTADLWKVVGVKPVEGR